jgi:hypothetical protein
MIYHSLMSQGKAAYERFWRDKKNDPNKTAPWENIDPVYQRFWCGIAQAVLDDYFEHATWNPEQAGRVITNEEIEAEMKRSKR